jgi:hypothetical protein
MGRDAPAFAVQLGETPYGFIGRFQAFNGNKKTPSQIAAELFAAYSKHPKTQRLMCEALISLFEDSNSYANAKELIGHLEDMKEWEPEYAKRIMRADERNSQISGSYGVSGRVKRLAKKWET